MCFGTDCSGTQPGEARNMDGPALRVGDPYLPLDQGGGD